MKKLLCLLIISTKIFISPLFPQNPIVEAAENGLAGYLAKIPDEARTLMGFTETDDFEKAELGEPFNLYLLGAKELRSNLTAHDVEDILTQTNLWFFPVLIDESAKCLLLVSYFKDQWQAVSIGSAPLAKEAYFIQKHWPSEQGYHPLFVCVRELDKYLFSIPKLDTPNLTLLEIPTNFQHPKLERPMIAEEPKVFEEKYQELTSLKEALSELQNELSH